MNVLISTLFKLGGTFLLFFVVYYASVLSEDNTVYYNVLHLPSLALVIVGSIGLAFATANFKDVFFTMFDMLRVPPSSMRKRLLYVKSSLKEMTNRYYDQGAAGVRSGFDLRMMPPSWDSILAQLESKVSPKEIDTLLRRHASQILGSIDNQIKLVKMLKASGPSLGMFGTILGLIKLLDDLSDFESIGPNMSLALITTLYGIMLSILLDPVISHLEEKRHYFLKSVEQSSFWLLAIADKKPSFFMDQEFKKGQ